MPFYEFKKVFVFQGRSLLDGVGRGTCSVLIAIRQFLLMLQILGLGTLLLITGFLAFNGGSLGHISEAGDSELVARSMVSTVMGGCGAAVVCLIMGKHLGDGPFPFSWSVNGILSGLVRWPLFGSPNS